MQSLTKNLVPCLSGLVSKGPFMKIRSISSTAILKSSDDPMHQVGPWPKTKEERERAARKYNLIPEDYEPHDYDDAFGDYPKLKPIGAFNRDPYDDYDDIETIRHHGEVYHKDADLYAWERIDPLYKEKKDIKLWKKMVVFFGVAAFFPLLHWFCDKYRIQINNPVKHRKLFPDRIIYEFPKQTS